MRRLLAIIASLAILAALPATAAAARPTTFTDHSVGIFCDGMTATSGGGFAFFSAVASDQFGPDAFVDYWATDEPIGQPDLFRDFSQPVVVSWDGSVLQGSIPLVESDGDPAGTATFSATLEPTGDPISFDDTFREGNRQHRATGVTQPMDPSGTLTIDGSTFSLDACFADETTVTVFETNPNDFAHHFSDRSVGCELTNTAGDTGFLFVGLSDDDVFIDAGATSADGTSNIAAFGFGTLIDGVLDAPLESFDPETGEPVAGGGSIHLEIVGTGERFDFIAKTSTSRFVGRGVTLDI